MEGMTCIKYRAVHYQAHSDGTAAGLQYQDHVNNGRYSSSNPAPDHWNEVKIRGHLSQTLLGTKRRGHRQVLSFRVK